MITGYEAIRQAVKTIPDQPGVYRMLNAKGVVIYVGKAKSLCKRLAAYSRPHGHVRRIQRMISQTAQVEITTTGSEAEALLLEGNLIKRLRPQYNILLRDDKSFPYIMIRTDHPWPQLRKHRGVRNQPGNYYGPFAATHAVNETLATLERAFLLRSCSDTVFANRTRPCLLYQIKRCCAPCVGRISTADYAHLVNETCAFLDGRDHSIIDSLNSRMQAASGQQDYERAAIYRDRIRALRKLHMQPSNRVLGDGDVIGLYQEKGQSCVQIFFYRAGRNYGNRAYFPRHQGAATPAAVLSAFIGQFYAARPAPKTLLLSHKITDMAVIAKALSSRSGYQVNLHCPQRGGKKEAVKNAIDNAREALTRKLSENQASARLLEQVALRFGLRSPPQRIEVYDNSHIQGRHALGAMVVAGPEGFERHAYRKFNARDSLNKPGDDYALLREVLTRRFTRLLKENQDKDKDNAAWPDLLLIDGGAGHLSTAQAVLADLGLEKLAVIAIAKGPQRHAGKERFYRPNTAPLTLDDRDPVLHYAQRLRDEVHRFAITGHRNRRASTTRHSLLEDIKGVGPTRKRSLILHLGSSQNIRQASVEMLKNIPGINDSLARTIYDHFHETDSQEMSAKTEKSNQD